MRSVEEVGVAILKSRLKDFASTSNLLIIVIADAITGLELHPNHFISSSQHAIRILSAWLLGCWRPSGKSLASFESEDDGGARFDESRGETTFRGLIWEESGRKVTLEKRCRYYHIYYLNSRIFLFLLFLFFPFSRKEFC